MAITIGVIGGTGGMGKWLAELFKQEGYPVEVSGRTRGMPPAQMARSCNVVVVAVPLVNTLATIAEIGPHLKTNSLLMDIASLKEKEVATMLKTTTVDVVGCHPLFGPKVRSLKERNIILCPARGKTWLEWLTDIFKKRGATVTITTPAQHDAMMAVVQALNHFHTLTMGLALQDTGIPLTALPAYMTPAFASKIRLIKKVCTNPNLYAEIIIGNPHAKRAINNYVRLVGEQGSVVARNDRETLATLIQECQGLFADFL